MPRYIDADALREEINSLSVTLCGKELFGELAKHSVSQKIDEAPTADVTDIYVGNKSAWISVDERLPESTDPATPVLVFTKQNRYYVGYYYKAVVDTTYTGFYADSVKRDVTHWMPLPEPPITDKPTQEQ